MRRGVFIDEDDGSGREYGVDEDIEFILYRYSSIGFNKKSSDERMRRRCQNDWYGS